MKNFNNRGFTLIELLIVISIIGVLSSIVMSSTNGARSRSRDAQRISQLRQIYTALALYYDKHGEYPELTGVYGPYGASDMEYAWGSMLDSLEAEGLIAKSDFAPKSENKTFAVAKFLTGTLAQITLNPIPAYAMVSGAASPLNITPQDPSYPSETYAYVPSNDNANFRIRAKLENTNTALNSSVRGVFYTTGVTTGISACDIALRYYCLGSNPSATFTP